MLSFTEIRESTLVEKTMELAGEVFQNMEHCPGAVSAFKQNLEDGASKDSVVKAAHAVDAYLAIEDKAKKSGATQDDLDRMKGLVDKAKAVISDAGLKGHTYHEMHLDRVKDMVNESVVKTADKKPEMYTDPEGKRRVRMVSTDKNIVSEKTLTPAEKKKREEIATAIEKDNPDMPMDKKMAIATATAKKVAEAQVDEISLSALKTQIAKSGGTSQVSKAMDKDKTKKDIEALKSRLAQANESYEDDIPASPDEKSMALRQAKFIMYVGQELMEYMEEDKEFPEWMQNKLSAFHQKAKDMHSTMAGDYESDDDDMNEDAQLDEVLDTPKAMDSYRNKAKSSYSKAANSAAAKIVRNKGTVGDDDHKPELKTMQKRGKGLGMADKNAARKTLKMLRKEETELDEGITKMSHARLKFHATKGVPHGSYSNAEVKDEHKRRLQVEPDYHKAKPALEGTKPDAVEVMRKKQQMANISTSDKYKLSKIRTMLNKEKKQ